MLKRVKTYANLPIPGDPNAIFLDESTGIAWVWGGSSYSELSTSATGGGVTKRTVTGLLNGSNMTYTISGAAADVDSTLVVSNRGVLEVTLDATGDFTLDATGLLYTNNGTALTDVAHGGTDSLIIYA